MPMLMKYSPTIMEGLGKAFTVARAIAARRRGYDWGIFIAETPLHR